MRLLKVCQHCENGVVQRGPCRSSHYGYRIEICFFNNTLIHTENSKINLDLKCSPAELHARIMQNCGVQASAERRGFNDFGVEFFYVDFIEAGNTKRAPFVLRTKEQVEMLRASQSQSIMVRITQSFAIFKKGSGNIVFESAPDSHD